MKQLLCALLCAGAIILPADLLNNKVNAATLPASQIVKEQEATMPNCIGEQFQVARDGLPEYFSGYGINANVKIEFESNTDINRAFTVKDQSIAPDTVITNSSVSITLLVYSGLPGQPMPLEEDEFAMPNCIGEKVEVARDGLPDYCAGYGKKATVKIEYEETTVISLAGTVKDQSITPDAGIKRDSSVTITLLVYKMPDTEAEQKDNVSDFVKRLYGDVLNRPCDEEGLNYWKNELNSYNLTGAQVAEKFILSEEFKNKGKTNEEYVDILYSAFFGREADAEGKAYWLKALDDGMERADVEKSFVYSQEWADTCASYGILSGAKPTTKQAPTEDTLAFVERMYTKALGRDSEPEGKAYWADKLANYEITGEQIAVAFFGSKEMEEYGLNDEVFLTRLYATFMDREADAEGKAYWMNVLSNNADRLEVVKAFANSPEFAQRCVKARIMPH